MNQRLSSLKLLAEIAQHPTPRENVHGIIQRRQGPHGETISTDGPEVEVIVNFTPPYKKAGIEAGIIIQGRPIIMNMGFGMFVIGQRQKISRDMLLHLSQSPWARVTVLDER